MLKQIFTLYRTNIVCLSMVIGLTACTLTPPHQQMSEARQALMSAQSLITEQSDASLKKDYIAAEKALLEAESAMQNKDYSLAKQLISESKQRSQGILKQHQQQRDTE